MSRPIDVAIADDSYLVRRVLEFAFDEHSDINLVASVENGQLAVDAVREHDPDLLILDIEMPVMDGLDTLRALSKDRFRTKTIVLSSTTKRHAPVTMMALALGAETYLQKPTATGNKRSIEQVSDELITLIKEIGGEQIASSAENKKVQSKQSTDNEKHDRDRSNKEASSGKKVREEPEYNIQPGEDRKPDHQADIIVLGCSTGGPNALSELFAHIPSTLKIPLCIVQHMPKNFLPQLAKRLNKESGHPFHIAEEGMQVEAGHIYLAPGEIHLTLKRSDGALTCHLDDSEPEVFCKPSVNPLFRSAVDIYGKQTLGIILTGMGEDGLDGVRSVHKHQGKVIIQDKESAVVWSMPRAVAEHDLADRINTIHEIADYLKKYQQ